MDGDGIGTHLECICHRIDEHLLIGIGTDGGACREMEDQPYVPAALPVTMQGKSHMAENRIGTPFCDTIHGLPKIDQSCNRSVRDPVIHGYDDRFPGVPVDDSFQTDFFSSHNKLPPMQRIPGMGHWDQAK